MKKLISLILLSFILLSSVSCSQTNQNGGETSPSLSGEQTSAENTSSESDANKGDFLLNANFRIIRSEYISDVNIIQAINYIRDAVSAAYGINLKLYDDWYRESSGLVPSEYEILVGCTNRKQSQDAYAGLKQDDYMYSIESENVITICGGNSESTLECAKKFCLDVLGYDGTASNTQNPTLKPGTSYTHTAEYSYDKVTINGRNIEDFVVGVKNKRQVSYAMPIVNELAEYNGFNIKVKEFSALSADDKNVIYIGAAAADGSHIKKLGTTAYCLSSKEVDGTFSVILDAEDITVYQYAVERFISSLTVSKNGKEVALTLPKEDITGYTFEDSLPKWTLKEEKTTTVCDGVTYTYQLYADPANKPYRAYILKIDPKKAYLYMGSTGDGYEYSLSGISKQNVLQHMNSAKANGVIPVAGVNADFFAISSDYHPTGLAIKEGKVIANVGSRPWCGFTYDGEFVCGESSLYQSYKGKLQTAVGASHVIVKYGAPGTLALSTEFSYTAHPRTLAGVTKDGTIILAVVDGRQANVSNGAPLARCAALMISHGAETAVNLDGGGSSCMIVQQNGSYKTMNSPSDGALRKVYNSLLVVPK